MCVFLISCVLLFVDNTQMFCFSLCWFMQVRFIARFMCCLQNVFHNFPNLGFINYIVFSDGAIFACSQIFGVLLIYLVSLLPFILLFFQISQFGKVCGRWRLGLKRQCQWFVEQQQRQKFLKWWRQCSESFLCCLWCFHQLY